VQKVDIFAKKRYVSEKENTYLQQKYSDHFNGRIYKTIDTLLLFTDLLDKKKSKYKFSEKAYKELRDKCEKVYMLLEQSECDPDWLFEKDFEYYIGGTLTMQFAEVPVFDNIKSTNEYLRIGSSFVKTISFVDVENIELPNEIETYSRLGGSSTVAYLAVDNFSFLNELEAYQTIVYNQVIAIPPQVSRQRELEKKMKKHDGVAKNAPSRCYSSPRNSGAFARYSCQWAVDSRRSLFVGFCLWYLGENGENTIYYWEQTLYQGNHHL